MKISDNINRQAGFSLLEVLVAIVVFAVGLLAIASLQGSLMQSGSDAKARTVASSLAEEQVEEIRSFIDENDFAAVSSDTTPESIAEGGVQFERTYTVGDYHYPQAGGSLTAGTDAAGEADAKLITVIVAWCDAEAGSGCNAADLTTDPNTVVVEDIVGRSASPVGSAKALSELTMSTPPNVPYDPGEAPEVVSIDLGDGKKRESPEPTINTKRAHDSQSSEFEENTVTRLETITFTPPPSGTEDAGTVRRQEFLSVNCTCEKQSTPADPADYGRTPYYWNGTDYVGGEKVAKPVGMSTLGNSANTFVAVMCSDCCRDHHDVPNENIMYDHDSDTDTLDILSRFDPFWKDSEGNLSQHTHYNVNNQDQLIDANNAGDEYLEACRFVRVDGDLVVANNFRMESLQALPANTCDDFSRTNKDASCTGTLTNVSSDWLSDYRQYVADFVTEYVEQVQADNTYPSTSPQLTDGEDGLPSLPTTDTVPNSGEARELVSRAIYIDFLTPDLLNRVACRQGGGSNCSSDDDSGDPVLPIMPFYEVNVQLQANWAVSGGNLVGVTSFPVDPDGYNRGFVYPDDSTGSETLAIASIEQGNTGLTDTHHIVPDTQLIQDGIAYGSGGTEPSEPIIKGTIVLDPDLTKGNKLQPSDVIVNNQDGASCTVPEGQELYECLLNSDSSGQVVVTGYTKVKRKNDGTIQSVSDAMVCLRASDGTIIDGTVINDGTEDDTTTFDLNALDPAEDRIDYDILVEPQDKNNPRCNPSTT